MPDLQTEIFTKVVPKMRLNDLNFDDDANATVEVVNEQAAANVTEAVWRYVRDNPGCTSAEIGRNVDGLNGGVTTRIAQLKKKGYIRATDDWPMKLYVDKPYAPLPKEARIENMMKAREKWLETKANKPKIKKVRGRPRKEATAHKAPNSSSWSGPKPKESRVVDLNNMSIVEARKLYDELKQIFGG